MSSTTKSRNPKKTKETILQAALEEFARHGFESASVRNISRQSNVAHGMIRHYYGTKDNLWREAVQFLFERSVEELMPEPSKLNALEGGELAVFRAWLRKYVWYCAMHPEHARIIMQESMAPSDRLSYVAQNFVRPNHQIVSHFIEILKAQGVFPAAAPVASIIYAITGACQNIFTIAPEVKESLNYDPLNPEAVNLHAETIVAFFCPEDPPKDG